MRVLTMAAAVVMLTGQWAPGADRDLREDPFFAALKGDWTGEGSLTNREGKTSGLSNRIAGRFLENGKLFSIQGNLEIDGDPNPYVWVFMSGESGESGEPLRGYFLPAKRKGTPLAFAVEMDEDGPGVTLRSAPDADGRSFRLRKVIEEDGQKYVVQIAVLDEKGEALVQGSIRFERG